MTDFKLIRNSKKLENRLDMMLEASPVSDYENYIVTQKRIQHKSNLSYQNMENRLKNLFKTIDAEIFVDRRPDFERIKKQLLKKQKKLTESKLAHFLKGHSTISETCCHIKELLNG